MASKADRFYFENLIAATEYSCNAANHLVECLTNFSEENLKNMLTLMHAHEHQGDTVKHEMTQALAKAFVTPVDREDLAHISANIDNVTDCIEEVLQSVYMYNIKKITPGAIEFAKKLVECCDLVKRLVSEFHNFKKPTVLINLIIELSHLEGVCDTLYVESTRKLHAEFDDALEIISWRKVYQRLEACADACEHVGDCIDIIVMKNS